MKEFYKLLKLATSEQRANLSVLTNSAFGDSPETLTNHIKYLRGGSVGQFFWDKTWKQVVTDVADQIHIDWLVTLDGRKWQDLSTQDIENAVVAQLFQEMLNNFSPEQRAEIIMTMKRDSDDPHLEAFLASSGMMAAARMSGFGVYLMASTVLGGLTNAIGITLPFAIYSNRQIG